MSSNTDPSSRRNIFALLDSETHFLDDLIIFQRLDGRLFHERRAIELHFGSDFGCAYVTLGETKYATDTFPMLFIILTADSDDRAP